MRLCCTFPPASRRRIPPALTQNELIAKIVKRIGPRLVQAAHEGQLGGGGVDGGGEKRVAPIGEQHHRNQKPATRAGRSRQTGEISRYWAVPRAFLVVTPTPTMPAPTMPATAVPATAVPATAVPATAVPTPTITATAPRPSVPTPTASPAEAGAPAPSAPVPTGAMPARRIPAEVVAAVYELRLFDIGRLRNQQRRANRHSVPNPGISRTRERYRDCRR